MKHKIIAFVFFLFAALQYNDGDAWIWIPIYLVVSIIALLADRKKLYPHLCLVLSTCMLIGVLTYIPQVIDWAKNGFPSITGSMKAESPFIEFIREFFGLCICLATLLYYYSYSRKIR